MSGLRLKLLGGLELRATSGAPVPLTARKPALLLACLALRPGQAQARDRLAGLLWAESGEAQARASLRQALAVLRQQLGPHEGLILTPEGGTAVALAADGLATDVAEFERCLAAGGRDALERAVSKTRGFRPVVEGSVRHGFSFHGRESSAARLAAVGVLRRSPRGSRAWDAERLNFFRSLSASPRRARRP
jgi:DNA-binding SARP family transcriptional activator